MAKEFTLKQRAGNGGAVEDDQALLPATAPIVNGALIDYLINWRAVVRIRERTAA